MAKKSQATFAKRQREMEKKAKKRLKMEERAQRKIDKEGRVGDAVPIEPLDGWEDGRDPLRLVIERSIID